MSLPIQDRLAAHRTLAGAPPEQLAWLAAHGQLRHLEVGALVSAKGQPVEGLFIVLSGHLSIYIDRGSGPHKVVRVARGRRRRDPAVLAPQGVAGGHEGRGADGDPHDPAGGDPGADPRVLRADGDLRPRHARPRSPLHVERPARGEDVLPRQARGGARARAEQSRLGGRAQRPGPQEPADRGRGRCPRARRRCGSTEAQEAAVGTRARTLPRGGRHDVRELAPRAGGPRGRAHRRGSSATARTSPPPKRSRIRDDARRARRARRRTLEGEALEAALPLARGRLRDVPAGARRSRRPRPGSTTSSPR